MSRDTIGKIYTDIQKKSPESYDPIELEREMQTDYEQEVLNCVERGKKEYYGSFFVVVLTKKERIMERVLRHYFFHRQTCPTPDYDQAVYYYNKQNDAIEFIWVIPSKDTCILMKENALQIAPEERGLLKYVLDFADGTLYTLCKTLNNEHSDSPFILKE